MNTLPKNSSVPNTKPLFTANNYKVLNKQTGKMYKTTTYFFRRDLDWNGFVKLLDEKYKNASKVNVYNEACSCGHEPVSLAIKLKEYLGNLSKKFFPIKAGDLNSENIINAKKGVFGITNIELYHLNEETHGNYRNYLNFAPVNNPQDDIAFIPSVNIRNNIEFKQGDIFENIKEIPSSNTVLLCRNFWKYLPDNGNNAEKLAKMLGEKLDSSSLVVIGEHDELCGTKELLMKNGFKETPVQYVFHRI